MKLILKQDKAFTLSSLFLLFVGSLSVADVFFDKNDQLSSAHLMGELFLITISFFGSAFFIYQALLHRKRNTNLREKVSDLENKNSDYLKQVDSFRKGLSEAIDNQFTKWSFTPSEKEVGIMIIKGLSYHEIADARGISERTARNQGSSLLNKAQLKNKSELMAFFLEDLLYPNV